MKYVLVNDTINREIAISTSIKALTEAARGIKRWSVWTMDDTKSDFEQSCVAQSESNIGTLYDATTI